jgi:Rps23 Pro-64 3,4-dihydroxylase Tpa1-like proline 4-hydroxylase
MYKIDSVLPVNVLEKYKIEIRENARKSVWAASDLIWEENLVIGITGTCLSTLVSDSLKADIVSSIRYHVPPFEDIVAQHYIWTRGSGIAKHNDLNHRWGATIYMNESWDINNGGLFVWKNNLDNSYSTIFPNYNTMVVNNMKEEHLVTPVSQISSDLRLTIQIWGR